ncbi:hypothetical protein ACWEVP_42110 [Amycolatopsis sp. NPDC003865]
MSRAGVAEAVRAAMTASPVADELVRCPSAAVRMFGAAAGVAYRPDETELTRRTTAGLGPITHRGVLDALWSLPTGLPVATAKLNERERKLLQRAPRGAVESDVSHIVRLAVAPVSVRFAVVAARTWREGLVKAGRFAPFCARAMLLPEAPSDLDDAQVQAGFYGIGICVFSSGKLQMLAEPERYVRSRHSSAQWWFAEEIYQQLTATGEELAAGG